ncbi:MAG: histidine kinase [Ruminiclostridium sp.]|nr:histidine kinase [Ruminiclostridium sp.]
MEQFIYGDILSALILVLLAATLVIKDRENRTVSFFIPGVLVALFCTAFSIYCNTVLPAELRKGTDPALAEIEPCILMFVKLCEAFSLSFFCLFLKTALYRNSHSGDKLFTVLSFVCVPLTIIAAFLPVRDHAYAVVFLLQTVLFILAVMFSGAERNVRAWFITAGAIYAVTCIIRAVSPETDLGSIGLMLLYLTVFIGYEVRLKNDMLKRELDLSEANNALLMRQISPHFIFNSLQVITGLCDSEPDKVKPALTHFSEYLRGNLESITTNELIPFTKELAHTKEYLALEQYGDGRDFTVEYDLEVTGFMLPPLVMQPIVENAVHYGIGTRTQGGHIVIETSDTPFATLIRVKDDGTGKSTITEQQKTRQSVGMQNVRARLKALCGGDLIFESSDKGTTVTITIPKTDTDNVGRQNHGRNQ